MHLNTVPMTNNKNVLKRIFTCFALILLIGFISSKILFADFLTKYTIAYHTIPELACVFLAVSVFFIVWHSYQYSSFINCTIGLGFLAIASFDIFHIIYSPGFNLYTTTTTDIDQYNLYRIFSSFTDAIILLVCSFNPRLKINRWRGVLLSVVFASGISYLILNYANLPELITKHAFFIRIVLEFITITLFGVGLFNLKNKIAHTDIVFRYIFLALLIAVSSELCFIISTLESGFYNTLGHILKTTVYYVLFRGILANTLSVCTRNDIKDLKFEQIVGGQKKLAKSGQMSAKIVYEIKDHLTTIKGFSQIIKSEQQDEQIKNYACIIENKVNEVTKAVSYFLNV